MIPLADIRQRAEGWWPQVLKAELTGESFFPKRVMMRGFPLGTTTAVEFAILEEVRENSKELVSSAKQIEKRGFGYTYYLYEKGIKANELLAKSLAFTTLVDYLKFIDREEEFITFQLRTKSLLTRFPEVRNWAEKNPVKILDHEPNWDQIVAVLEYFQSNPMPNSYVRELELPISTKFIEQNIKLLDPLLQAILPSEAMDDHEEIFERKYGLKRVEPLIRICFLDEKLMEGSNERHEDFGLPVSALAACQWPVKRVLVIENLTSLLSLRERDLPNFLGLHGHGYRVANFSGLSWLNDCELFYWGDIDVQGFEILSLFRRKFPHAKSVLMDRFTIDQTPEKYHGQGKPSSWRSEPQLTPEEYEAYCWAREGWRQIEQEHLPIELVMAEFSKVF